MKYMLKAIQMESRHIKNRGSTGGVKYEKN